MATLAIDIKELEGKIKYYDYKYWIQNDPVISDIEYDAIVNQLKAIDPNNPLLHKIHTPSIINSEGKVQHSERMFSLDKVYSISDMLKWCTKVARTQNEIFNISPKFDGCSGELNNGILATRGDGIIGENVSSKIPIVKTLHNNTLIPATQYTGRLRGELIVLKNDFINKKDSLIKKDGKGYKTERQAAAGLLNRDDINLSVGQILTLVDFETDSFLLSLEEMKTFDWDKYLSTVKNSNYPADGIVIKIHDHIYHEELGFNDHHSKAEIALKFANPSGQTTLIDIIWSLGKETITPIAVMKPVVISGVTIEHANLHNWKNILTLDLKIGDEVIVERAGDAVPDIVEIKHLSQTIPIQMPTHCPICNELVQYIEPDLYCTNNNCPGKLEVKLMDSVVRFGIERLGRPTLKKMIKTLNVKNMIDIMSLTKEDIMKLEGFTDGASSNNLYNEIQKIKIAGVTESQILASLNLSGIGLTLSTKLLTDRSLEELKSMTILDLVKISDVGAERANVILSGLEFHWDYIMKLKSIVPIIESKKGGLKICLTGNFPEKKKVYEDKIIQAGFQVVGSVSKDLSYLVCDELKGSSKQKQAEKYGIPIITSNQLLEFIGG